MSLQYYSQINIASAPENYEQYFVPAIAVPLANDLIEAAALRPGERVLDVACGTGVVARLASERVGITGNVAGLDINSGMLAVARSKTPSGMSIEWHEASAYAMPFPDASFNVALCQLGLQFVPDKQATLREMQRVLASGGRLTLNVAGPMPRLFAIMGEALSRHIGAQSVGFLKQIFSLYDIVELQNHISGVGFHDVSVEPVTKLLRLPAPEQFLWQYVCSTPLAGAVAQVNDECRKALEHDVITKWQEFVKDGTLTLQLRIVVVNALK